MMRYTTFALFLACLCGLLAPAASAQDTKAAVPVVVIEAKPYPFRDRVEALGTLRANEGVAITAVVADKISSIKFEDGDRVEPGQVLVEMTTAEEAALLEEARSTLEEAKAQYERSKSLTNRQLTPETVYDQRRRDYQTAQARVSAMEARLSDRILKAPFAGRMGLRTVSAGSLVNPGDVIARLEDDSVMKLDFSVPSTFIAELRPGLEIVATARGFDNDVFRGKVASIDNRIDEITRTIRVRAVLPNPDRRLVPGLLMSIDLFKSPRQSVAVREEALVPIGPDTYVFVVDKEKLVAQRRRIETGTRLPGVVEVTAGLAAGETVVSDGTLKLRDGSQVTIKRTEPMPDPSPTTPAATTGQKAPDKPAGRT
ncbi:MAG: efflux RND transporter periplasmic adaptor subunit [Hyphomicrobiaceae bacterium]|nr:efflux RND transporter periplasmic adaptor subunit [Hyphomicrobiaceae bacterium]MCC0006511.1 efflux RND transporter periplasmic adaptor subunit [Hyphomicrobiaceae bacterium]